MELPLVAVSRTMRTKLSLCDALATKIDGSLL